LIRALCGEIFSFPALAALSVWVEIEIDIPKYKIETITFLNSKVKTGRSWSFDFFNFDCVLGFVYFVV